MVSLREGRRRLVLHTIQQQQILVKLFSYLKKFSASSRPSIGMGQEIEDGIEGSAFRVWPINFNVHEWKVFWMMMSRAVIEVFILLKFLKSCMASCEDCDLSYSYDVLSFSSECPSAQKSSFNCYVCWKCYVFCMHSLLCNERNFARSVRPSQPVNIATTRRAKFSIDLSWLIAL